MAPSVSYDHLDDYDQDDLITLQKDHLRSRLCPIHCRDCGEHITNAEVDQEAITCDHCGGDCASVLRIEGLI